MNFREEWVTFRRVRFYDIDSKEAREGYERGRTILVRGRNAGLASLRKELDNFTCQACDFRLEVDGRFVIEVHHCDPLAVTGETDTTIDDLISLCPTCHRIAHLRSTPYRIGEIRAIRSGRGKRVNVESFR